jgi:hypothetical protein
MAARPGPSGSRPVCQPCRHRPCRSASSCSISQSGPWANTLTGRILITTSLAGGRCGKLDPNPRRGSCRPRPSADPGAAHGTAAAPARPGDRRSARHRRGAASTMKLAADDMQSVVIPGCGHYCLEEAPEEVVAALTAFLARTWKASDMSVVVVTAFPVPEHRPETRRRACCDRSPSPSSVWQEA